MEKLYPATPDFLQKRVITFEQCADITYKCTRITVVFL